MVDIFVMIKNKNYKVLRVKERKIKNTSVTEVESTLKHVTFKLRIMLYKF